MQAYETQYVPGQIHTGRLGAGSVILAIEGTLRVLYRDESLNWLLDASPVNDLLVCEGERYRLPCEAFVEIAADGKTAAVGVIEPALTTLGRCAAWIAKRIAFAYRRPGRTARTPLVSRRSDSGT